MIELMRIIRELIWINRKKQKTNRNKLKYSDIRELSRINDKSIELKELIWISSWILSSDGDWGTTPFKILSCKYINHRINRLGDSFRYLIKIFLIKYRSTMKMKFVFAIVVSALAITFTECEVYATNFCDMVRCAQATAMQNSLQKTKL